MDEITKIIRVLQQKVENIEKGYIIKTLVIPSDGSGYLAIPILSADPSSPVAGEIWFNSSTNQLKVYTGSATKAVTLT